MVPVAVLGALLLTPLVAHAGNGLHPRTEVVWSDTTCFEVVDRSVDPIYEVEYDIPFEDTDVTPDEVMNSRTHQFFGICRQFHSQIFLPNWITWADVADAVDVGLVDMNGIEDDHVIETNPDWDGCWFRVNGDDERRPITNMMASMPVPWDTTGVPVGTYVIWGYTYEPAFNLWKQRQGSIVKVIDGGDPVDIGPGAAITTGEQTPYKGESVAIDGCVNALSGSTMTGYFASTSGASDPDWTPQWAPFIEDTAVEGESFTLDFLAPDEFAGEQLMIRLDVTDPMGRTYEAHMKENVIVLKGMDGDCETGGNFIGGAGCGGDESESSAGASDSDSAETAATDPTAGSATDGEGSGSSTTPETGGDDGGKKSCACTSSSGPAPVHLGLLLVLFGIARRRRAA
jgi:MYXO-CTERM domain-containing protein